MAVAASGDEVKVFVDTAAVMEKPLAQAAGLGWQGKHTNMVSREFGSWLFLGAILPPPSCRATRWTAIIADHAARARISARPQRFRRPTSSMRGAAFRISRSKTKVRSRTNSVNAIGNRIYGCDDCLAVCPWNKFAQEGREAKLAARAELRAPRLSELARLDDGAFRALFAKSPVKRIGRDRFIRNVLIAIGNSDDAALAQEAERLLGDESALVAGSGGLGAVTADGT